MSFWIRLYKVLVKSYETNFVWGRESSTLANSVRTNEVNAGRIASALTNHYKNLQLFKLPKLLKQTFLCIFDEFYWYHSATSNGNLTKTDGEEKAFVLFTFILDVFILGFNSVKKATILQSPQEEKQLKYITMHIFIKIPRYVQ